MEGLYKAIEYFGSRRRLARALGVRPMSVTHWTQRNRPIPAERAVQIEHATNGAVYRGELRPDLWPGGAA